MHETETEPDPSAELRQRPGWWARLEGEALDLGTLAESVHLATVHIERLDGNFYLSAADFQAATPEQSGDVLARATEIVRALNGAAKLEHGNAHEVGIDALTFVGPHGQVSVFKHLSGTVHARARASAGVVTTGTRPASPPPPSALDRATEKGLADANAERALRIFGRDDADYRDLYHVFEIAQAALGAQLYADGTVTPAEVRRFTHTAQSPTALGDTARHGHERNQPPPNPMPFAEARDLVRRILRVWLVR